MKIGFNAPSGGPLATPDNLVKLAQGAEALGFGYATFSDHVVIPADISTRYPYTDSGEFPAGSRGERHEQLTEVAWVAAKTSRLRLVTSVMVVPHRPPVLTAKILSTIDVLSGGRLTVGIGTGWLKEEIEALGASYEARGRITDEYMMVCKALWTQANPSFSGEFTRFENLSFEPKPVQKPHPPIWIGGESGPALRRVARLGDGWYPIGTNPQFPLDSLERYQAGVAKMRKLVAEAGRDPASITLAYRVQRYGPDVPPTAGDGKRRLFAGQPEQIVADLRALQAMGVDSVDLSFPGRTAEEVLDAMQAFQTQIIAKV
jgi:probable F420-dependent oxidoreductase